MEKLRPSIDPCYSNCAEAVCNLILCALRRNAERNEIGAVAVIPDVLTVLESIQLPFETLEVQKKKLHALLTDARLVASSSTYVTDRFDGSQFGNEGQIQIIKELEKVDVPFDLKYLAAATSDDGWVRLKTWWARCPPSLRWITIVTERKYWLAYVDLYSRAPEDLRWVAVAMDDPRWLHFCAKWRFIPKDLKLKALQDRSFDVLRQCDEFHGARFELWDCEVGQDLLLIPAELRGSVNCRLNNRCLCCPIHCRWGTVGERLDLKELKELVLKIDEILIKDRAEKELKESEWQKRLLQKEAEWRQQLARQDVEMDRLKRELQDQQKAADKRLSDMEAEHQKALTAAKQELDTKTREIETLKKKSGDEIRRLDDEVKRLKQELQDKNTLLNETRQAVDKNTAEVKAYFEKQVKQVLDAELIKQAELNKLREKAERDLQLAEKRIHEVSTTNDILIKDRAVNRELVKEAKKEAPTAQPKEVKESVKVPPKSPPNDGKEVVKKEALKAPLKDVKDTVKKESSPKQPTKNTEEHAKDSAKKVAPEEPLKKEAPKVKDVAKKEPIKAAEPKDPKAPIKKDEPKKEAVKEEARKAATPKEEAKKAEVKTKGDPSGVPPKKEDSALKKDLLPKPKDKPKDAPKSPPSSRPASSPKVVEAMKPKLPAPAIKDVPKPDPLKQDPIKKKLVLLKKKSMTESSSPMVVDNSELMAKLKAAANEPLQPKATLEQMRSLAASSSAPSLKKMSQPPPPPPSKIKPKRFQINFSCRKTFAHEARTSGHLRK
eukprot:Blabericola_migrator_1__12338@NODE_772_length_6579_cov_9_106419_g549_i0_p1_GENE_NODE_772_length_6579_cov_9_106419_g549_i0NODE_772_length_6579_cov_9_106419_g549_i0_p1_ORF_typecomplete_len776_score172_27Tht1/PF04163_12/0_37Prominin/PF05478_11/7_9_NODE_772_length_6579_cov_9_106419_g549_i011383465